jgi:dipeptide/tripeptide permease
MRAWLQQLNREFHSSFWVANFSELFERLAFYGQQAFLMLFLTERVRLSDVAAGQVMSWFGLAVYALPVVAGTLADRFGFRRALALAYVLAGTGYFLLGSVSAPWMQPLRQHLSAYGLVLGILLLTALGPALVKPCVVGTVATASSERVRSLGYSIYYTVVNAGGALGPLVGARVVEACGLECVFRFCGAVVLAMCVLVLLLFREAPGTPRQVSSVAQALGNMLRVLANGRFVSFLLIFSGYWVMFYAFFVVLPVYVRRYMAPALSDAAIGRLLAIDAAMIILFQVLVSTLTARLSPERAMVTGVVLAVASMLTVAAGRWVGAAVAGLVVFSIGEMIQAPRFYEYVSRLAPPGQQGVFMGYAFLPIALGYFLAGQIGGRLLHHYGEQTHRPGQIWMVLAAIGVVTVLLMLVHGARTRSRRA